VTAASETCPFCRAALSPAEGVPDRRADRQAAALERPCGNAGCSFEGKRSHVEAHRAECPHNHVELRGSLKATRQVIQGLVSVVSREQAFQPRWSMEPSMFSPGSAFRDIGMHCHAFDNARTVFDGERLQDSLACMRLSYAVAGLPRTELRIEVVNRSVRFTLMRHTDEPVGQSWERVVLVLVHPEELGKSLIRQAMIPPAQNKTFTFSDWVAINEIAAFMKKDRLVVAVGVPSSASAFVPAQSGSVSGQNADGVTKTALAANARRARASSVSDPSDTNCGICCDVLNDAHQAPCCGQLACRDCLDNVTAASETCPFCRAALSPAEGVPDRRADRQAAALERPCGNAGCSFEGKRSHVEAHRAECPHNHVELRGSLKATRQVIQGLVSVVSREQAFQPRWSMEPSMFSPGSAFRDIGMHCHAFDNARTVFDGERLQDSLACMRLSYAVAGLPRTELRIEVVNRSVRFTLMRHTDEPVGQSWERVVLVLVHPEELGKSLIRQAMIPPARNKSSTFSNWVTDDQLNNYVTEDRLVVAVGMPSAALCFA